MGRRTRELEWRSTSFGAPESWPQSLRSALNICLHSSVPTAIYWGPDLRILYNDAWAPVLGPRHPWALARRASEVWSDIWTVVRPQFEHVISTGEGFHVENQLLPMQRYDYLEETYWNYSLTPIFGEDGRVAGIFTSAVETTATVLAEERAAVLIELGDRFRELFSTREIKAAVAEVLGRHLEVARAGYADIGADGSMDVEQDWASGQLESLAGAQMHLSRLGNANARRLREGHVLRIDQAVADTRAAAFGVIEAGARARSLLMAPLVRAGQLLAAIYLHDVEPRHWRDSDAVLLQEVLKRTSSALEQARAEEALRASEERYRLAAHATSDAIWDWNLVTDRVRWSEALRTSYGYAPEGLSTAGEWKLGLVHPDDRDRVADSLSRAVQGGLDDWSEEYRFRKRDGSYAHVLDRGSVVRNHADRVIRMVGAMLDLTERKRAEHELRESEARFRNLADNAPVIVWVADESGNCEYLNKRWYEFTGQEPEPGSRIRWMDPIHPEDAERAYRTFLDASSRHEPFSLEYRLRWHDDAYRWAMDAAAPRFGPEGEVLGYIGSILDISERKESEQRQNLLMREIDHRAKNVLAVVQAVLRLSNADDPAEFRSVVEGRVAALARAHSLLSASRWEGVDLGGLLREELSPYLNTAENDRVSISGPTLLLPPSIAQTIALALHELTTNAAKHGSLSGEAGSLAIAWKVEHGRALMLSWREEAGAPVSRPERQGFGSELLVKSVEYQAKGTVALDWRPTGLVCRMRIPLQPTAEEGIRTLAAAGPARNRRVLIVEDEALIALELEQRVERLGYQVADCVGSLEAALHCARNADPEIALLDVNLHGELSIPVAVELYRRGVPLAFVTGYEEIEGLPEELREIPLLTKPVSDEQLGRTLATLADGLKGG